LKNFEARLDHGGNKIPRVLFAQRRNHPFRKGGNVGGLPGRQPVFFRIANKITPFRELPNCMVEIECHVLIALREKNRPPVFDDRRMDFEPLLQVGKIK
jgi:hypothetical protein